MASIGSNPASLTALVISSGITCAIVCMMPQIFDRESAHVLGIVSTAFSLFSDWPTSGVFSAIGRGSSVAKEIRLVRFSSGPKTGFRTESIRPSHRTSRNNQTVTSTTIASTSKETTMAIKFQRSQCCEPPIALGLRCPASKGNPVGSVSGRVLQMVQRVLTTFARPFAVAYPSRLERPNVRFEGYTGASASYDAPSRRVLGQFRRMLGHVS